MTLETGRAKTQAMGGLTGKRALPAELIEHLKAVVGPKGWLCEPDEIEPYLVSWRDEYRGRTPLVVRPAATAEVAAVVGACAEAGVAIVPQGGNTGLTGAGIPHMDASEIVLSLSRMNRVREVDPVNDTITVEAGCVLADIQTAAAEAERLFPLSLAAQGSCQIGGNLSTDAGGVHVLRYGTARDLTLGLEVVLPDGRVWNGLRGLRKDSAGYDMKQLFIGAEGTLGVITAAVLKLFARPGDVQTAFAAVPDPGAAVALLGRARRANGEAVACFELMQRFGIEFVLRYLPDNKDPLDRPYPWYVLIELWGQSPDGTMRVLLEDLLAQALDDGLVLDATVAASAAQARALWRLREGLAEAQNPAGVRIKHDISVPVSRIAEFIERAAAALTAAYPGIRPHSFGHLGDGNVHCNPVQPAGADGRAFQRLAPQINRIVHDIAVELGGSISAEHGIGQLRREEARRCKPGVELELMRTVKSALDPRGIMNPGKVI